MKLKTKEYYPGDLVTLGHKGWAGGPQDIGVILGPCPDESHVTQHYNVYLSESRVVRCIPWDWFEVVA